MLKFKLLTEEGEINEKLFEDYFNKEIKNTKMKLNQLFKININTKIDNKTKTINIKDLKEFKITGFEIPMVEPFFYNLKFFIKEIIIISMNN